MFQEPRKGSHIFLSGLPYAALMPVFGMSDGRKFWRHKLMGIQACSMLKAQEAQFYYTMSRKKTHFLLSLDVRFRRSCLIWRIMQIGGITNITKMKRWKSLKISRTDFKNMIQTVDCSFIKFSIYSDPMMIMLTHVSRISNWVLQDFNRSLFASVSVESFASLQMGLASGRDWFLSWSISIAPH